MSSAINFKVFLIISSKRTDNNDSVFLYFIYYTFQHFVINVKIKKMFLIDSQ